MQSHSCGDNASDNTCSVFVQTERANPPSVSNSGIRAEGRRVIRRLIQRGEMGQFEGLRLEKVGFLIGLVYDSNKFLFVIYIY